MSNQFRAPYKYHFLLRKIYEGFGTEWFTFRQLWDTIDTDDESGMSARTKMNDMSSSSLWSREKKFLYKVPWEDLKDLFPNATKYQKKSNFWKITEKGLQELEKVFDDIEIREEHVPIIAKAYLENK